MNKNIILIIIAIVIVSTAVGVYYYLEASNTKMKTQSFDDVTLSVPLGDVFTKNDGGSYQNQNKTIVIGIMDKHEYDNFMNTTSIDNNPKVENLDNLRADAQAYKLGDRILIFIPNSDNTRYASISIVEDYKNLAVEMTNSLVFSYNNNTKKNNGNNNDNSQLTSSNKLIGESAARDIVAANSGSGIEIGNIELNSYAGKKTYAVYVKEETGEIFRVDVDAYTGKILS